MYRNQSKRKGKKNTAPLAVRAKDQRLKDILGRCVGVWVCGDGGGGRG